MVDFTILENIQKKGYDVYLVGGVPRDLFLKREINDVDVEVHGVAPENLSGLLSSVFGSPLDYSGKKFGVIRTMRNGKLYEFSVPRRDIKTGPGHMDFDVVFDPYMSVRKAAERRDFTVNALYLSVATRDIYDFFNGTDDLKNKILRPVNAELFVHDPLRFLRAFSMVAKLGFFADDELIQLAQDNIHLHNELEIDAIHGEWVKWAQGSFKSTALRYLKLSGWLLHYPELERLEHVPQDERWHPEGNVWEHTLQVVDHISGYLASFAALTHDMGKISTTVKDYLTGAITSKGHAASYEPKEFLKRVIPSKKPRGVILRIVKEHMSLIDGPITKKRIRRLLNRASFSEEEWNIFINLLFADMQGRYPRPVDTDSHYRVQKAYALGREIFNDHELEVIIDGRTIMEEFEFSPGPQLGQIKRAALNAQIDGEFNNYEDGILWVSDYIHNTFGGVDDPQ